MLAVSAPRTTGPPRLDVLTAGGDQSALAFTRRNPNRAPAPTTGPTAPPVEEALREHGRAAAELDPGVVRPSARLKLSR